MLRLVARDDGSIVVERAAGSVDHLGRASDIAAAATRRLTSAERQHADTAAVVSSRLRTMLGWLAGIAGAGAIGMVIKKTFDYNQELVGTTNSIAGLLAANRDYVGAADQWVAATAESAGIMKQLQIESLKTAATVPQIG
ncbi:MAG TPA: hypothetical protein VN181_02520, partial [Thermoanaerobaculia bacterium]|nr:hypothetical protein [Thermoanaerobaculia bacterium]